MRACVQRAGASAWQAVRAPSGSRAAADRGAFCEHRTHHLCCPGCGKKAAARLPDGVGDSPFGTDLQAAVVTMTARNRVSRRDMSELARDLFGLRLSVGAVDAICQRAGESAAGPTRRPAGRERAGITSPQRR